MAELLKIPLDNAALFDRIPDGRITAKILIDGAIDLDYVAVRIQADEFTDFETRTVSGHQAPLADVMDCYRSPIRHPAPAMQVMHETGQEALNVMLVPKGDVMGVLARGHYGAAGRSWIVFPLLAALERGARLYRDIDSASVSGQPFIIALPKGTRLPVEIMRR